MSWLSTNGAAACYKLRAQGALERAIVRHAILNCTVPGQRNNVLSKAQECGQ